MRERGFENGGAHGAAPSRASSLAQERTFVVRGEWEDEESPLTLVPMRETSVEGAELGVVSEEEEEVDGGSMML